MKIITIGLIVFLLCISIASASASEINDEKTLISAEDLGYTIVPGKADDAAIGTRAVTTTITQGETNWHSKPVTSFTQSLKVDLNWGDSSDSLKLYVYDPSGNLVGTFYDSFDGTINGRTLVYINNDNGIEQGTWRFRVYGLSVSGTEDYSI
ncbi:peptidase domain-containing protein [Methanolobus sp. ZRKC2]|uniref:peptidase domain-containing protein n=1 Tax=Methanolobus sp. ZRKC2 TaxID=3125783 RepID=UPI003247D78E